MKISKNQIDQVLQTLTARPGSGAEGAPLRPVRGKADEVSVSRAAERLHRLSQMIAQLPDVRPERLGEITAALERGDYDPSALDVAEKMLGRILADKL